MDHGAGARVKPRELYSFLQGLERLGHGLPTRVNADPHNVERGLARLVPTLIDLLRRLMERQAIRRMDAGTLTADEIESIGQALMKLEKTVRDIAARFDLAPEDLNLDLGPIGKLT